MLKIGVTLEGKLEIEAGEISVTVESVEYRNGYWTAVVNGMELHEGSPHTFMRMMNTPIDRLTQLERDLADLQRRVAALRA